MRQKDATRLYQRELWASIALYGVILVLAIRYGRPMPDGLPRTLVLVSPMLGFGVALWAIVRHVGRMDEYIRRIQLENIAIAAAVTAGLSFTYGFLETAGFPRLSMFWVWGVMGSAWALIGLVRCRLWAR